MKKSTIAIIGAGTVGSTTAYTLILKSIASTLILVDVNDMQCKGQAADLIDAAACSDTTDIMVGTLQQAGQADIVIITAGAPQKSATQSRLELLSFNKKIVSDIIAGMKPLNPALIIIVVTNPTDVLTYLVQSIAGLPRHQVFGSGTFLDTLRLRSILAKAINIAPQSLHIDVLGEHGDSQFIAWSSAYTADTALIELLHLSAQQQTAIAQETRNRAYDIIACKGSTAFGIAQCIAQYCHALVFDTKQVIPISCFLPEFEVCLSMPAVLGQHGIEKVMIPPFNAAEKEQCERSVALIKNYIDTIKPR